MGRDIESGPRIGHWVAERLGMGFFEARSTALGLARGGEILAGVIYENWNGRSLTAHFVVEGRLTPAYIAAIFDYAFNVCAVEKVICPVVSTNGKCRNLLQNMGFEQVGELKDCHPQGDILLYTLSKEACRFLGARYGQKLSYTTPGA